MKTIIRTILTWCVPLFLLVGVAAAQAQDIPVDTVVKRFQAHRDSSLQEKIYAHIDRTFYLTGETLWFKIYAVDGSFHKPLDLSKVAYAEILDKGNFPVLQAKIELRDGRGEGSFFLPASLMSGNYKVRIYTSWMKNFSPEYYYDETFALVNPFVSSTEERRTAQPGYTIGLFPEGGNLVAGIRSKIAFRILNGYGKGANIRGWVLKNKTDTVAAFSPEKFGIGFFFLTPAREEQYRVVLDDGTTKSKTFSFPVIHHEGFAMQVKDSAAFVRVTVNAVGASPQNIYLFAHARQSIVRAETRFVEHKAIFEIPKKQMAEGITHLTLFNSQLEPLCERLCFTFPDKRLEIDLSTDQKSYSPRKKVSVTLKTGRSGERLPSKLSMAVYKVDSLSSHEGMHIYPYLWLSSDLTGRVESPEYYFNNSSESVKGAMDNLMLTHGWRRFDWKDIVSGNIDHKFLPEIREHIVKATVRHDGKERRGVFTYFSSPGKSIRSYGAWSDNNGAVKFLLKDFYGPRKVILQTRVDSTESHTITLDEPFSSAMDREKPGPLHLNPAFTEDILSRSIAMQVQDIFSYQHDERGTAPLVDSSTFYGKPDASYYLDDYTRFPVMEEVMREYVTEVFVRKRRDGFHFIVAQKDGGVLQADPMVLLDGVPILDADHIMQVDPLRIKKLDVIQRLYYLGEASFPGIVSFITYQADLGDVELDPRSVSLNYEGLQLKREFPKPQYNAEDVDNRMPDQRYLLHWEPDISTDSHGNAVVEFFTSDVKGPHRIIVEGLNEQGYAGTRVYDFIVNSADNQ